MAEGIRNPELIKRKERQIALAAAQCIKEKGFNQMTVRDLAKASGLTIGNLYDYIGTKEDTLYLVYKEVYGSWVEDLLGDEDLAAMADPREQLLTSVDTMLRAYSENASLTVMAFQEARFLKREHLRDVLKEESRLVDYFANIVRRGTDMGVFRDVDAYSAADAIIMLFSLVPLRGWSIKRHSGPEAAMAFCKDFILEGLLRH